MSSRGSELSDRGGNHFRSPLAFFSTVMTIPRKLSPWKRLVSCAYSIPFSRLALELDALASTRTRTICVQTQRVSIPQFLKWLFWCKIDVSLYYLLSRKLSVSGLSRKIHFQLEKYISIFDPVLPSSASCPHNPSLHCEPTRWAFAKLLLTTDAPQAFVSSVSANLCLTATSDYSFSGGRAPTSP